MKYSKACCRAISSLSFKSGATSVTLFLAKVTIPSRWPIIPPPAPLTESCASKWIDPFARTDVVAFNVPC